MRIRSAIFTVVWLLGCRGTDTEPRKPHPVPPSAGSAGQQKSDSDPAPTAEDCARLSAIQIAAGDIGLPTTGASITVAEMQTLESSPLKPAETVAYCMVRGEISPVDPSAPPIIFQVNLPLQWNGKAVMYGGGAFNGKLVEAYWPLPDSPRDLPAPIARGFATWGCDSGHDEKKLPEIWAYSLNEEALVNYAYASYKKTRDVGRKIVEEFYRRPPTKLYHFGLSEGGREGLAMAQRFPDDFDGIVALAPAVSFTGLSVAANNMGIVQQDGGWLNTKKLKLLADAVMAKCDGADGLNDSIISAFEKCIEVFDPTPLLCRGGRDKGDHCLSRKQLDAILAQHRPLKFGFEVVNGTSEYPGWNYGGEAQFGGPDLWIFGKQPSLFPIPSEPVQGKLTYFGNGYIRYFVAQDPKYNPVKFKMADFKDRLIKLAEILDTTDPDLSAFHARGGKVIMKVSTGDFAISPFQTINYYKSVVAKLGQERVDEFIRFYVMPGGNHGGQATNVLTGERIPDSVDLLGMLDEWATTGKAPGEGVQVDQDAKPPFALKASRPMCLYPRYPHYDGKGDPKQASSFTCASQDDIKP